ncbi:hypothetical protein PISL3812_00856 [Talaromyces islandicus]|uniref:Uncharacterized protein n=1 Tax=Talaromyces islandicus TaxID=28573 RepID=A0A0U1LKM8_TALIS|nr:hypothetical protein PISL3812_00856 [Talaromyces islandicus]
MSHQQSHSTLQFRNLVHQRARQSEPLSNQEVDRITRETAELAGVDQPLGDPTQTQWLESANVLHEKPASAITREDAKNVHRQEVSFAFTLLLNETWGL